MRKFFNDLVSKFLCNTNDCKSVENTECNIPSYSALCEYEESVGVSHDDRASILLETFLLEKIGEAYLATIPEQILPILRDYGTEEHKFRAKNIFELNSDLLETAIWSQNKESCVWFLELMDYNEAVLWRLLRHPSYSVVIKSIDAAKEINVDFLRELKKDYLQRMSEYEAVNPEILDHLKATLRDC